MGGAALQSMTGFGRAGAGDGWQAEVRSVNSRYLDVAVRLPEGWRALEPRVRARVAASFRRGRIEVTLVPPTVGGTGRRVLVDTALAASYDAVLKEIAGLLGRDANGSAALFLGLPGVCHLQDLPPVAEEAAWSALEPMLGSALAGVEAMRRREGMALRAALITQCEQLARYHGEVSARQPDVLEAQRTRWRERFRQWSQGAEVPEALLQALDHGDVAEELARIASHLEQVRDALSSDGPVGRRLDFLAQEFQREWTTISAKAVDAASARVALEARVVAEQLREQIQNVE